VFVGIAQSILLISGIVSMDASRYIYIYICVCVCVCAGGVFVGVYAVFNSVVFSFIYMLIIVLLLLLLLLLLQFFVG
jgi:hypothetical protein